MTIALFGQVKKTDLIIFIIIILKENLSIKLQKETGR